MTFVYLPIALRNPKFLTRQAENCHAG